MDLYRRHIARQKGGREMTARDFFDLVARMRDKQKEYFRTRSGSVLQESKQLEKQVDEEIKRVNEIIKDKQEPKLF